MTRVMGETVDFGVSGNLSPFQHQPCSPGALSWVCPGPAIPLRVPLKSQPRPPGCGGDSARGRWLVPGFMALCSGRVTGAVRCLLAGVAAWGMAVARPCCCLCGLGPRTQADHPPSHRGRQWPHVWLKRHAIFPPGLEGPASLQGGLDDGFMPQPVFLREQGWLRFSGSQPLLVPDTMRSGRRDVLRNSDTQIFAVLGS